MNLVIDIGNTRIKAALFQKNEIESYFIFNTIDQLLLSKELFNTGIITHAIVGSVVDGIDHFIEQLNKKTKVLLFNHDTKIPLKNLYKSAHTLGSDRLSASIGANALFPGQNLLIIDAGTCIKYNFVNKNNEYIGGAISPGLQMRFKALNTFTSRLPLLETDENFNTLIGTTSNESILSGVQVAVVAEIEGIIEQYKKQFKDLKIVLTGGDTNFFEKRIKKPIFADQNIILKGLNEILEHNKR